MILIVGLGNPGSIYANSRHNLGFRVVEKMSKIVKVKLQVHKHRALCTFVRCGNRDILLARPLTYMNRSGLSVSELVKNYDLGLEEMLVIYDDLDLLPGSIRLRKKGGGAGHRGVQSIIDALGSDVFPRLRIGIGKAPPGQETADYVLMPVTGPDCDLIEQALERAVSAVQVFIRDGLEKAMNEFNSSNSSDGQNIGGLNSDCSI